MNAPARFKRIGTVEVGAQCGAHHLPQLLRDAASPTLSANDGTSRSALPWYWPRRRADADRSYPPLAAPRPAGAAAIDGRIAMHVLFIKEMPILDGQQRIDD